MRVPLAAMLVLSAAALPAESSAQSAADFYKGKTVTIVVGFTAGGGTDVYGRLVARHLDRHIPGNPTLVVQNMPGAGSMTSVRYLDANAPKDGTVLTTFIPALITESVASPEKVQNFKFSDVAWVGSVTRDFRICYAWHTVGVKTWDDVMKRGQFVVGATAPGTGSYVNGAIMRNVFGAPIKIITGYPGSNEQRIAVENGELDGNCGSWSSIGQDWIRDNKIAPFIRFSPVRTPDIPEHIPFIGEFAKTEEQKSLLNMLIADGELGRPYIMSKQVPPDRLQALRAAFDSLMKDEKFLADAANLKLPVNPASGADADRIINAIYSAPAQLREKAAAAIQ